MDVTRVHGHVPPGIKKSGFCEFFKQKNQLDDLKFKAWFFLPGMQFDSPIKWWGKWREDFGKRQTRHEGLDLCLYKDQQGRLFSVDADTKVPAMYDGVVVAVIKDFLGHSVVVGHGFPDIRTKGFCTIYAHTVPRPDLVLGMTVREGDVLATVADALTSRSGISPHVHISVGFLRNGASYDRLNWLNISRGRQIALFDPLALM